MIMDSVQAQAAAACPHDLLGFGERRETRGAEKSPCMDESSLYRLWVRIHKQQKGVNTVQEEAKVNVECKHRELFSELNLKVRLSPEPRAKLVHGTADS